MSESRQSSGPAAQGPRLFATTHWSLVRAASTGDAPGAVAALEKMCQTYWRPVYVHVLRHGYDREEARDLTQDFFAQLLRENTLAAADPGRGRFRCFLLGVLKRFLAHARTHALAQKRGGGQPMVSWEQDLAELNVAREAANGDSPDQAFDRHWALAVMREAHERLRAELTAAGRDSWFEALQAYLTAEPNAPTYAATAARLGVSEGAVKSAIHRLRQRYFAVLRSEVAATLEDAADIEDELRYLRSIFSAAGRAPP